MDPFHPVPYVPRQYEYCVCDKVLPAGPYVAQETSELGLIYISFAHPKCLAEWGYELNDSEFGVGHSMCQEDAEEDVKPS